MKFIAFLSALLLTAPSPGCTARNAHDALRFNQELECQKLPRRTGRLRPADRHELR